MSQCFELGLEYVRSVYVIFLHNHNGYGTIFSS